MLEYNFTLLEKNIDEYKQDVQALAALAKGQQQLGSTADDDDEWDKGTEMYIYEGEDIANDEDDALQAFKKYRLDLSECLGDGEILYSQQNNVMDVNEITIDL